jgi:phosphate:Na+ symporter
MTELPFDFVKMLIGLGGGLAIFLYGMRKMTDALKLVAGSQLKNLLAKFTTNRFTGALSGAAITAVVQSSSVTSVMVVGFVSAGLMTFTQSVGVIMGANIGTTITAQIVAFKVTEYSLLMIAGGFLIELLAKTQRVKLYGIALMGLGMLFFGMALMSDAALPLRSHEPFINAMKGLQNPLMGVLGGLLFTAIVQSSSATTGISIVLAAQGFISLETGIALIFGANIGTCVTAALSAIGKPREAVKSAAVHVVFNILGVLLWVGFIPYFADAVRAFSPVVENVQGAAKMAAEVPRQIANTHTLFNIVNTLIFIGFAESLSKLVERIVPKPKSRPPGQGDPIHINSIYLDQPAVALDQAKLELTRLSDLTLHMVKSALPSALSGMDNELNKLRESDDDIDSLHGEIITFLGELSAGHLVEPQPERVQEYLSIANYLENVGDIVESGFVTSGYKRLEMNIEFHASTIRQLDALHAYAVREFECAIKAFIKRDISSALKVLESKSEFNELVDKARNDLSKLLGKDAKGRLSEYRISMEHVENIKRIHTLSRGIAQMFLDFQKDANALGD